jgi:transposase
MTISNEICARIVGMCEGGMKGTDTTSIVGVLTKTMQKIIKQFKEGGTYKENTSTGRPKKLGERDLRRISLFSRAHSRSWLQDITNDCPMEVSTRTVCRALHNHDIFSKITIRKPFLTLLHMSGQLDFVRQYC